MLASRRRQKQQQERSSDLVCLPINSNLLANSLQPGNCLYTAFLIAIVVLFLVVTVVVAVLVN